ncbi:MAG TPA: hypothetical protein PK937_15395, partial [bacterium]|nr:hypothetical protein [bacterium]
MNNKGDLRDIETLLDQMRKQQGVIPLTDDVVEFLLSQSEPIQPSQKLLPELEVIISKAINERETSEQAQRQQASTFGEYIKA